MLLKEFHNDKIIVVAKFYDEKGNLTSIRFGDEERTELSPQAASLIEGSLTRAGWTQINQKPYIEDRRPTQVEYSIYLHRKSPARVPAPIEPLKILQGDKIVVISRSYDEEGNLISVKFADEEQTCLTPEGAWLIEKGLARTGWTLLEDKGTAQIKYSVYLCPDFLGRIATPIERKADGTLNAQAHIC